jgi:hypothetical protein
MSTLFRGITKTVPSLFRGIFRNEISMATLSESGASGVVHGNDAVSGALWRCTEVVHGSDGE